MTYETFLAAILSAVQARVCPGTSVSIQKILKNNGLEQDGLYIQKEDSPFAPVICLAPYYEEAKKGIPVEELAERFLDFSSAQNQFCPELDRWIYDFSQVSERVAFRFISVQDNKSLLSSVPHIPFLDLALVFYLILEQMEDGQMTVLIHNEHAALWHTDAEELCQLALKNTPSLLPYKLEPLENSIFPVFSDTSEKTFHTEEIYDQSGNVSADGLYILTNSMGINGAACMLYPDVLKNFAALVKDDLFILPSSIHEVLLSPVKTSLSIEEINQMIEEINELEVSPEERLSNHAYYYNAARCQIVIPVTASASDGKWNLQ